MWSVPVEEAAEQHFSVHRRSLLLNHFSSHEITMLQLAHYQDITTILKLATEIITFKILSTALFLMWRYW